MNLSLPPIDGELFTVSDAYRPSTKDQTLLAIFNRFNSSDTDELSPDDFAQMVSAPEKCGNRVCGSSGKSYYESATNTIPARLCV